MAKLNEILEGVSFTSKSIAADVEIDSIACDSRKVRPKGLFIAVGGTNADGYNYISQAIEEGASCVVAEKDFFCPRNVTKVIVANSRDAMAKIAKNFYADPSKKVKVVGVTGTNGKTTTTYLVENIFKTAGLSAGVIGTVSYRFAGRAIPATNTTPGVLELQSLLSQMARSNMEYAVLEVSSHSLDQGRVEGINFECAAFTNLTHDHLDYHKDVENYFVAKAKLFDSLSPHKFAVINRDDPFGRRLLENRKGKAISYGLSEGADVYCKVLALDGKGARLILRMRVSETEFKTKLIGRYNLYNLMAAVGIAFACDVELPHIIKGIEEFTPPPGRLERVDSGQPFDVFVDYAHTDDALRNVLTALRELHPKRLLVLFGCGGDRDTLKRPKMGRAATELADFALLTSDNPRSEDAAAIIREIESGIVKSNYEKNVDRKEAIEALINFAKAGDIVLLAGKGHEAYQVFKDTTVSFDDRQVAREALEKIGYRG